MQRRLWSANLLPLPADTIPGRAIASAVGLEWMIGAMVMAMDAGQVLQKTGSYRDIFALIGGSYLFALLVVHLLASCRE